MDPLIKSHLPHIDGARLFSRPWRKAPMLHQKVAPDFPTAELPQVERGSLHRKDDNTDYIRIFLPSSS